MVVSERRYAPAALSWMRKAPGTYGWVPRPVWMPNNQSGVTRSTSACPYRHTELSRIVLLRYACDMSSILHHITRIWRSFHRPVFRSGDSHARSKSAYKNENVQFKITVFFRCDAVQFGIQVLRSIEQTARRHIPKDRNLSSQWRLNSTSHVQFPLLPSNRTRLLSGARVGNM
jgi:hypothetical protein